MKRNELGSNDGLVVLEFKADQVVMVSDELATIFVGQLKCATYTVDVDDGLAYNAIRAIGQDSKGFMWFGSELGLTKFDGFQLKRSRTRLSKNTIPFRSVAPD